MMMPNTSNSYRSHGVFRGVRVFCIVVDSQSIGVSCLMSSHDRLDGIIQNWE